MARQGPRGPRPTLYPAQAEGVRRALAAPNRRYLLAYSTGCGKTATALCAATRYLDSLPTKHGEHGRLLVVCPAMVRRHWVHEARRWVARTAYAIEYGHHRQLGHLRAKMRDAAYAADWRVTSYDLVRDIDHAPYDAIILDEIHHLGNWSSRQSTRLRQLVDQNPQAMVLGLSATLIPTDLWQLWHPLRVVFGERAFGACPRAGPVNWEFARRWCHLEVNEYGTRVGAARQERLPQLRKKLATLSHRLTREDIADDLPPLHMSILEVPGSELTSQGEQYQIGQRTAEWYKALPSDVTHTVVLAYHRSVAKSLGALIAEQDSGHVAYIDGSMTTGARIEAMARAQAAPRACLIATSESIREGIRLMWPQQVLLAQWQQSPVQIIQVLGRFQSVGDKRRPHIQVLTDDSMYGAACRLIERTRAINAVLQAGKAEAMVEEIFSPRDLDEARLAQLTRDMLAQTTSRDDAWQDIEAADEW